MANMKLQCASRSGKVLLDNLEVPSDKSTTLRDFKKAFHSKKKSMYPERQRWTFDGKPLDDDSKTLDKLGIKDGSVLVFKDLGPQIGWRTVFFVEYLGPLLIYPLFYYGGKYIYGQDVAHTPVQQWAFYLLNAHFLKRELETLFIHRFSHGTMPVFNIFKNSFHYWILSGVLVSWDVFKPSSASIPSPMYINACVALWAFAQVSNFTTHVILMNLRPPGTRVRKIPHGYGFNFVSCPNYYFEAVAWTALTLLTQSWAVGLFLAFSTGQMYVWAVKKHKAYRKEFPDYPRSRKAMFPFIA